MIKEFLAFLKQYGVIGLAIAVVIGGKLNAVVTALVEGLLMPLLAPLLGAAGDDWRTAVLKIGGTAEKPLFQFGTGQVLGALIDFLIVAIIVFWFSKKILKEDAVTKK
ncbi:MAG TPA: MscL family protein [Gemmatimonadales bacterium]|nr:MscL family protein [Gemmatimonadales bacterium]